MTIDVSTVTMTQLQASQREATPRIKKGDVMKTEPPVSMDEVIAELSDVSAALNKRLAFSINDKLGQVVVKVIDTSTDKVIREIPPAELQHVHERIREVIGILFDERA